MIIIWLHDTTHDYSMSVLYKGKIYSIELERLVWIKKWEYRKCWKKIFFQQFLMWQETNMWGDTLTFWDYWVEIMYKYFSTYLWIKSLEIDLLVSSSWNNYETIINSKKNITPNSHHLMHAHSVYNMSWYKNSNILVIDWAWYNLKNGKIELQSMFYWSWKHIKSLEINYATKKENIWIGIAYSRISDFLWLTEWKMMWLSGYSEKSINYNFFDKQGWRVYLKIELHEIFCNREKFFHYYWLKKSFLRNWYFNKKIINFVFSFQREVESAIIYLANYLYEKNPCENLSYAWGVALNCLTNYRLKTETKYKNIFVLPASNDAGISLWNLFYWVNSVFPSYNINIALYEANYWLWKKYNDDEIITSLSKYEEHLSYKYIGDKLMVQEIFNYIKDNKIVWIFRWWSEFWPRALWNRSIIVSPYVPKISGKLNVIKNREEWRPFW